MSHLRPQVLGRVLLKSPSQPTVYLPAQAAASAYYVASQPVVPQYVLVYGPPVYTSAGFQAPIYATRPPFVPPQQFRAAHSVAGRPRGTPAGRAAGLGLVDESFFAPAQHAGYVTAYTAPASQPVVYTPMSGYATAAAATADADEASTDDAVSVADSTDNRLLHPGMTVDELCAGMQEHFARHGSISVSWLNRLFSKCASELDFLKGLEQFETFQSRRIETTPETGTLLIKAACRAGVPEKALELLCDVRDVRLWPTLGGIHYLMINFSIKKDTESVLRTFEATRERHLKPNVRTYHILIRECVDTQRVDDALRLADDCKASGIAPNRVMFNILMNGCRKANKPNDLLKLRAEMDSMELELNDTTVKFTVLAHLMLSDNARAADEFLAFVGQPPVAATVNAFAERFLDELADEPDAAQHVRLVRSLFDTLVSRNTPLDQQLLDRLVSLETETGAASATAKS